MKLALLLPGYLDSPDYLHLKLFEKRLIQLGYEVIRVDACDLWSSGDTQTYTITNYLRNIETIINNNTNKKPEEIILIGHSLGGYVAILAGNRFKQITRIVALCPPPTMENRAAKWKGQAIRQSRRDLPNDPHMYRIFEVPISYAQDALNYSAIEEIKNIHKPVMIGIALNDLVVLPEKTEQLAQVAHAPYVVKFPDMRHDFRKSQLQTSLVMDEIERFLKN